MSELSVVPPVAAGDGGAAVRDVVQGVPHRPRTRHARRRPRHHERRRLRVVAGKEQLGTAS